METAGWPDYVFKEDYDLQPLSEIERYIQTHGHLPEIPKAAEVEANGVSLGEMNRSLLKKVEELTLYLIEKEKEIQKIKAVAKEVEDIKQRLLQLEQIDKRVEP